MGGTRTTGDSMRRAKGCGGTPPPSYSRSGGGHREYRLRRGERLREDHVDVVAEHLGIDWRRPLILAIDEFCRPVWHHVAREGGVFQHPAHLCTPLAPRAFPPG